MDTIDFQYHGTTFTISDKQKYPRWTASRSLTTVQVMDNTWRSELLATVGLRYGPGWLRKRVLRAARAANPDRIIEDGVSITMPVVLGLEWTATLDAATETTIVQGVPELYMSVGHRREYYVDRRAERGPLQRVLDGHTFGLANEHMLDDVWEQFSKGDTLEILDDNDQWSELIERALRALVEPPTSAPAFPTNWQQYLIEGWQGYETDSSEFEHITEEAMTVMAGLGLEPNNRTVEWDTYPTRFACRMDPCSLMDVINGATSSTADELAAQNPTFAEYVENYRRYLLTPKTVMVTAVPLYVDAMACVVPQIRVTPRGNMSYQWEADGGYGEAVEDHDATDLGVSEVVEGVMSDVQDAVDYLCGVFASQYEDHYEYITSDEGVWDIHCSYDETTEDFISHVANI